MEEDTVQNSSDQAQPREQTNESPLLNEKSKRKLKITKKGLFVAFFTFLLLILAIIIIYSFYNKVNKNPEDYISNFPTPELIQQIVDKNNPEVNAIYYGTYNGKSVIFKTNLEAIKANKNDPYFGLIRYSTGSAETYNFKDMTNPIKILSFQSPVDFGLFVLNENKDKIYLDIIEGGNRPGEYPNSDNIIYIVDLNTLESKIIWENPIGSNLYGEARGEAQVQDVINDEFAILDILGCYGCEPVYAGNIILNIKTGGEKYIDDIGNININIVDGAFSYQKLANVIEPCPDYLISSPWCNDDGTMEIDRPRGQIFTEDLP